MILWVADLNSIPFLKKLEAGFRFNVRAWEMCALEKQKALSCESAFSERIRVTS